LKNIMPFSFPPFSLGALSLDDTLRIYQPTAPANANNINSDNPNDWKQAIIEADIMLDDVLTKLGYRGDSIGDKLKRAEPADFSTLNEAWEAHKVRNQIAHSGSTYPLNQHEANRVIQMYRKVFEEFYYL